MKKILFTSMVLFFTLTSFAICEDNDGFADRFFKELDINKDNVLDKNDIKKYSKNEFELMDVDKDGVVSQREFLVFVCKKSCTTNYCECNSDSDFSYIREYYDRIDLNGDGKITFEEKLDSDIEDFYNFDANNDGKITKDEIEAKLY